MFGSNERMSYDINQPSPLPAAFAAGAVKSRFGGAVDRRAVGRDHLKGADGHDSQ